MDLSDLALYLRNHGVPAAAVADIAAPAGNYAITVTAPGVECLLMVSANIASEQQITPTTDLADGFAVMVFADLPGVHVPPNCVVYQCEGLTGNGDSEAQEAADVLVRVLADLPTAVPA